MHTLPVMCCHDPEHDLCIMRRVAESVAVLREAQAVLSASGWARKAPWAKVEEVTLMAE